MQRADYQGQRSNTYLSKVNSYEDTGALPANVRFSSLRLRPRISPASRKHFPPIADLQLLGPPEPDRSPQELRNETQLGVVSGAPVNLHSGNPMPHLSATNRIPEPFVKLHHEMMARAEA